MLRIGNTKLSRRQVGIALAVFNGCYGGSIMVPLKFCPDPAITNGIGYVWSFSIGAMVVTTALWIIRYLWVLNETGSVKGAYQALPSLHLQEMWKPGGLSGLLWSIGNLFSILAVDYLGEGVGYCVCQASMLVSGLWGIFYFQEVKGAPIIFRWFLSALLTVSGILLLSYEHHEA
jgi:Transmembrane family, TMEM144 of transporters